MIVVGGANSAGQAAVFLSQTAHKVHMLVRRDGLAETMSRYLIQRIAENPAIELHCNTEIVGLGRERTAGARDLARQENRRNLYTQDCPPFHHGGRVATHGMAAGMCRARW